MENKQGEKEQADPGGIGTKAVRQAWREMPRSQRALLTLVAASLGGIVLGLLLAWARHDIPLKVAPVTLGMLVLSGVAAWHSWIVKGPRQTIIFWSMCIMAGWCFEFIGHHRALWFGYFKYTDALQLQVGHVPVAVPASWPPGT